MRLSTAVAPVLATTGPLFGGPLMAQERADSLSALAPYISLPP
jgi:hypothetical protein